MNSKNFIRTGIFAWQIKPWLVIPACHIKRTGLSSAYSISSLAPFSCMPEHKSQPPNGGTLMEFLAPSFNLAKPWICDQLVSEPVNSRQQEKHFFEMSLNFLSEKPQMLLCNLAVK